MTSAMTAQISAELMVPLKESGISTNRFTARLSTVNFNASPHKAQLRGFWRKRQLQKGGLRHSDTFALSPP
jgi:hypothetical protein